MKKSFELRKALSNNASELVSKTRVSSDQETTDFIRRNRERIKPNSQYGPWSREDWDAFYEEVEKHLERNRKLIAILETLIEKSDALTSSLELLSDEEFDQRYNEIDRLLEDFKQTERSGYKESFTLSFVDISSIENFEQFIKGQWPMQFIPHKEEVGRILALAKEAHSERLSRDESASAEPIRIVDIGGSNGALGKLVVDLARENGLETEYITIDPDEATVQAASEFYRDDHSLKFASQTAEEYVANLYANNPEVKALIDLRKNRIQEGERKIKELKV